MQQHKNFMLPPISDEMRRRLDEAVGRVENARSHERPATRDEALGSRPTFFAWMLREER